MPIKLSDVKSKFTGKQTYSYRKVRWFTEMSKCQYCDAYIHQ